MKEIMTLQEMKTVRLSPNFTLDEFCYHPEAVRLGIYNVPNEQGIEFLRLMCKMLLQPIRDYFKKPVKIVKGYTNLQLNRVLKGAINSAHIGCRAVDFRVSRVSCRTVAQWVDEHLRYDLMMLEFDDYSIRSSSEPWLHVSFFNGFNRRYNLTTERGLKAFRLSKNFSLWDLVKSVTATERKIFNVPDEAGIDRLSLLVTTILQPVRNHYGKPVRVNSGYRSPKLNAVISKASKSSQHMLCEAVDFEIMGLDNYELAQWIANSLTYDQLILEFYGNDKSDPNDGWVHVSYTNRRKNRRQNLTINNNGTKSGLIKS